MERRRDAMWGTARFSLRARELIMRDFTPGVCNIGVIQALPGAYNIVPARVEFALEYRHGSDEDMDAMRAALVALLDECAAEWGLGVEVSDTPPVVPARMDEAVMRAIERAADGLGLSNQRLLSFAGHDTQNMARVAPAAMYFVPSVAGISHNPNELTHDADCVKGGNVMLRALVELMKEV